MKLLACLLCLALAARPLVAAPGETEAAAVTAVLHAACRAYQAGDAAALGHLLTEDYTLTDSRGQVTTREQDLAEVRSGAARYVRFENRDMRVRIHGDAAIVTGRTHIETANGQRAVFQFTDTLIRRDGRWRVAASHATRVEPK
jgi:uncharacterized protein (TIGR02246 family)